MNLVTMNNFIQNCTNSLFATDAQVSPQKACVMVIKKAMDNQRSCNYVSRDKVKSFYIGLYQNIESIKMVGDQDYWLIGMLNEVSVKIL